MSARKLRPFTLGLMLLLLAGCGNGGGGGGGNSNTTNPPTPTVSLSATPDTILPGGSTVLSWTSQNTTTCNAANGWWSGPRATSGSEQIPILTTTTTFLLECFGAGGKASGSATVVVTPYETPFPYVDVLHTRLVFDETRGLLYAFVPPADATHPNSFAIIDVSNGTVTYTAAVNFVPFTMTVAPDGSYLYIGTAFNNEIIRLSLPDFSINLRFSLGGDPNAPPTWPSGKFFDARHIAVSPTDPELFAVSLVDNLYWTCATGVRVYKNSTQMAVLYNDQYANVGDILVFGDDGSTLMTMCSGMYPEVISRLAYGSGTLTFQESHRGAAGSANELGVKSNAILTPNSLALPAANELGVKSNAILTGTGSKFDMPGYGLRGSLPPLTNDHQDDPAPLLDACVFADDSGNTAACLSQTAVWEGFPTQRAFVLYELIDANSFGVIPLDRSMSHHASRIIRTAVGEFAVSVGFEPQNPIMLDAFHYMHQNRRIYFLSGIDTTYP